MVAIYADADAVVIAGDFEFVPLAVWFFDLVRAAETFDVVPWIATGTVEAGDGWAFSDAVDCQVCAADDEDVAGATFDHLGFDGFGPDSIASDKVNENAAVAGIALARSPCFFAPFEFGDEFVVGEVGLFGGDVAVVLAGDVQGAVFPVEDVVGIFVAAKIAEEGVEVVRLQKVNGVVGSVRCATGKRNQGEQK